MSIKDKIINRIKEKARETADSMLKKSGINAELTQDSLRGICKLYLRSLGIAPGYAAQVRPKIVGAVQEDVATLISQGKNNDEIVDFYWTVEEFKLLWSKFNMQQSDLQNIINYEMLKIPKEN